MKKLIILSSVVTSLIFAFALANAEDYPSGNATPGYGQSDTMNGDMAGGTMGEDEAMPDAAATESPDAAATASPSTKRSRTMGEDLRSDSRTARAGSKTCIDRDGIRYSRGETGYDRCMQEKSARTSGGAAGMAAPTGTPTPDMGYDMGGATPDTTSESTR